MAALNQYATRPVNQSIANKLFECITSISDGTPPGLLRCELAAVGYREISLTRLTGSDAYLAIFAPPSIASRTRPEVMVACKAP
jgi:hypothetical protein